MSIIIYKHNPQAVLCIFRISWQVLKFCRGSIRALTVTTIHEQPFPLSHYCGTDTLALLRQPQQRICCSAWSFVTTLQFHRTTRSRSDQYFWTFQPLSLGLWSKTQEFDDSTITGKWKRLFLSSNTRAQFIPRWNFSSRTKMEPIHQHSISISYIGK